MHDPRKPRPLTLRSLNVLVVDANSFTRDLIVEILRNLGAVSIASARDVNAARAFLAGRQIDVVLVSSEAVDARDNLDFIRSIRGMDDNRLRRLPVVLVTYGLTRETVLAGRDAGADEFLAKPISPAALLQRLQMVIETPRPFVASSVFVGPCRRRKNPADYHGAKRRAGERAVERPAMVDQDDVARETPIRRTLARLREMCASRPETLNAVAQELKIAKAAALGQNDHALCAGLASFESYMLLATPLGHIDPAVVETALSALEQLSALPPTFVEARESVAEALDNAIQKKCAA